MRLPITSLFIPVAKYPRIFRITSVQKKKQMFKHLQNFGGKEFCLGFWKQAVDFLISILSIQKLRNIAAFQQVCRRQGPTCLYTIIGSQNSTPISLWDLQQVMEQGHMLYFWLQDAVSLLSFLSREKEWIHSLTTLLQSYPGLSIF